MVELGLLFQQCSLWSPRLVRKSLASPHFLADQDYNLNYTLWQNQEKTPFSPSHFYFIFQKDLSEWIWKELGILGVFLKLIWNISIIRVEYVDRRKEIQIWPQNDFALRINRRYLQTFRSLELWTPEPEVWSRRFCWYLSCWWELVLVLRLR